MKEICNSSSTHNSEEKEKKRKGEDTAKSG